MFIAYFVNWNRSKLYINFFHSFRAGQNIVALSGHTEAVFASCSLHVTLPENAQRPAAAFFFAA